MKATVYKALAIVEGIRIINFPIFAADVNRLQSEYMEYESLMATVDALDKTEGHSSSSEAILLAAEAKLEKLMVDYLTLVKFQSRTSCFGWALRPLLLTKNPKYDYLRKMIKEKLGK